jgi:hypothetical protein
VDDYFARVEALITAEPALASDAAGLGGSMRRLCAAAGKVVGACGVGMTVMAPDGGRGVTAATDAATERLEDLQLTMGEGPCIEAFERRIPVLIPDVAEALHRWPGYIPAVHASGVRAVFAFPMQVGASRLGVLDVFRDEAGPLTAENLAMCLTFAEVAVNTLLDGQERARLSETDDGLGDGLGPRTVLFQAQGMVMIQLDVSLADALARIRAHAYAENRALSEVAADIVARRLHFEGEQR